MVGPHQLDDYHEPNLYLWENGMEITKNIHFHPFYMDGCCQQGSFRVAMKKPKEETTKWVIDRVPMPEPNQTPRVGRAKNEKDDPVEPPSRSWKGPVMKNSPTS